MIYTITGPSGSGKTALVKMLTNQKKAVQLITTTSRPKRDKEVDGVDYHFIDLTGRNAETFAEMNKFCFIESTVFAGNFYGTSVNSVKTALDSFHEEDALENPDCIVLAVVDLKGAKAFKNYFGSSCRNIYISVNKRNAFKRLVRRDGWKKAKIRQAADEEAGLYNVFDKNFDCVLSNDENKSDLLRNFFNYTVALHYQRLVEQNGGKIAS